MADDGTMQAESFDDLFGAAVAETDGTAQGDEGDTPEGETGDAGGDQDAQNGGQESDGDGAEQEGEGDSSEDETGDCLTNANVTLEELLEGIEDPMQRQFIETRYKQMQGYFTKATQAVAREKEQIAASEQPASPEAGALRAQVDQLTGMVNALLQAQKTPAPAQTQPKDPDSWRREYITAGLGDEISVDDAVSDPAKFAAFIRQEAVKAARSEDLRVLEETNRRIAPVERMTMVSAQKEAASIADSIFASAPQYRTPENEQAMANVLHANPNLGYEQAFALVVGPQIQAEAFAMGQRTGEVAGRKRASEMLDKKARYSVPSQGGGSAEAPDLPAGAGFDEIFEAARKSVDGG